MLPVLLLLALFALAIYLVVRGVQRVSRPQQRQPSFTPSVPARPIAPDDDLDFLRDLDLKRKHRDDPENN